MGKKTTTTTTGRGTTVSLMRPAYFLVQILNPLNFAFSRPFCCVVNFAADAAGYSSKQRGRQQRHVAAMVDGGRGTLRSRMSVARDNESEGKEDMPWRGADNLGIDDNDDNGGRPRRSADADESREEGRGGR